METLGVQRDLITKMSNIYWIMSFYGYAYESVTIMRNLCQKTRNLWLHEQDVIIRMFEKQVIYLKYDQPIDEKTIEALKRGDRYKLFKLDIENYNNDEDRLQVFYKMLDEMPDLEISMIHVWQSDKELINTLAQKPIFRAKQNLFKVLDSEFSDIPERSEPYEYLLKVRYPQYHDMNCYVKHAGCIEIKKLHIDMNVD